MNIHITNSHVIFAILTQYRWVSTSVIYFRCIYTSRNLGGEKKVSSYRAWEEKGVERVVCTCKIFQTASYPETRRTQRRFPLKYIDNTFSAIQSTFRCLEMYSKRHYKICICSVVLGVLESSRNYKGLSITFPKILDAIWRIMTKARNFLISLSIAFLSPKILGFLFSTKNSLTWEAKCEK